MLRSRRSILRQAVTVWAATSCSRTLWAARTQPAGALRVSHRRTPVISSAWFRIVEDPDHHLNDFCLFRSQEGRWHALGIMGTGTWGSEQSLFHFSGPRLNAPFVRHAPILTAPPPETPGRKPPPPQKHAPFVVYHRGLYHLFYRRPMGTILCARSPRPDDWPDLGVEVFSDQDARDVCIVRIGGTFFMYYCQLTEVAGVMRSCILLRRSVDLQQWSEPTVVHVDKARAANHSYLESPFVLPRPEGYYLFVRHRLLDARTTTVVLFSDRPDAFPSGRRAWFCELDRVHAPEIVIDDGKYYIARVSGAPHAEKRAPARGGWVELAELTFR